MDVNMQRFGHGGLDSRELFLVEMPQLASLRSDLGFSGPHFACLVLWDARSVDAQRIARFARSLLDRGAVYVCAWGPDCERVHDIFDQEEVGDGSAFDENTPIVMTTWHDDETLQETLKFFLNDTSPEDEFAATCRSAIVISIGSAEWATVARAALSDAGGC